MSNIPHEVSRIINDHDKDCPCYVKINKGHPTIRKRRDHEVM